MRGFLVSVGVFVVIGVTLLIIMGGQILQHQGTVTSNLSRPDGTCTLVLQPAKGDAITTGVLAAATCRSLPAGTEYKEQDGTIKPK